MQVRGQGNKPFTTIKNEFRIDTQAVQVPYEVICPVSGNKYDGVIKVDYCPYEELVEFISFQNWVLGFDNLEPMIQEEVADLVVTTFNDIVRPKYVTVTVESSGGCSGHVRARSEVSRCS